MANNLFFLIIYTTLAFFFFLTNASIYRTIIDFNVHETTNPIRRQSPQKCQKEFVQSQHLRACQQWIRMQTDKRHKALDPQQSKFVLQTCCNELEWEEPVCVCPGLKVAAREVRVQGQHGPFQASRIFRTAKRLPNVCKTPKVDTCPFRTIPFFPPYY